MASHPPPDASPDPAASASASASAAQTPRPSNDQQPPGPRRTSFNFLRRKSSSENRAQRSVSGGKMSKKQRALAQEEALRKQREAAMLPRQPPRLPSHSALPQIETFGGEDARPDSVAIVSNKAGHYSQSYAHAPQPTHNFSRPSGEYRMAPVNPGPAPPLPTEPSYMNYDPYPRTESMTHRGRYSYASSAVSSVNSPRRVRRRKDPTPFK